MGKPPERGLSSVPLGWRTTTTDQGITSVADTGQRRPTFQNIAWFWDLYRRKLLNLEPPYQRRSVWNDEFKRYFIETVLLEYPAPAIFLHEVMAPDGTARYSVVDGKQRLTTVFEYAQGRFALDERTVVERAADKYFEDLDEDLKLPFWRYQFSVEFVPSTDEAVLTDVFNRINKNTAKLSRQELRHAKYSGDFASSAESMLEAMTAVFPPGFPRIADSSRRQMKDVELVAQLLLLVENGPQSFSQDDLDVAYNDRDVEWPDKAVVERDFSRVLEYLARLEVKVDTRRIRNQADFYSLFGAVLDLEREGRLPDPDEAARRLEVFMSTVEKDEDRLESDDAKRYYDATRSASNDLAQRVLRIAVIRRVLAGD